jgi:hypothetical protein
MSIAYYRAGSDDIALLAFLLAQLIEDEGGPAESSLPALESLLRDYLARGYQAILFTDATGVVAYALYHQDAEGIYLHHFFVSRHCRRRSIGPALPPSASTAPAPALAGHTFAADP